MRTYLVVFLGLVACAGPRGESLGKVGGAPPSLILTSGMLASNDARLGEATLYEELQGDRLVLKLAGLPKGRVETTLHDRARCSGTGFADAGPARREALPVMEVEADGKAELYADLPAPRLRDEASPRLDADGMAVIISLQGDAAPLPLGCATFRLRNAGAIDGD